MDRLFLIENTAQEFWALAGRAGALPYDIETAITLSLPLEVYPIPALRVSHLLDWTKRAGITHHIPGKDRLLHGCLLADKGHGTIFFDISDPEDEQRFTLAHELAHFLLDYQLPRQRAITILGSAIIPVLDAECPPTLEERLHAVLSDVPLGVVSHLMERPDNGVPTNTVIDVENRADRLALELLAPAQTLYDLMQQPTAPQGFVARLAYLRQLLTVDYGLPADIAAVYARFLLKQLGEPTVRDWLSGTIT